VTSLPAPRLKIKLLNRTPRQIGGFFLDQTTLSSMTMPNLD
jgi:hypothetical protein